MRSIGCAGEKRGGTPGQETAGPILIIEGSGREAGVLREQLEASKVLNGVRTVFCVGEAERYLNNEPPYTNLARCPKPRVLFIDASLPKLDRSELMRRLERGAEWQSVLVIALVRLEDATASQRAYAFGADCVLVKPCSMEDIADVIARFPEYWTRG